MFIIYIIDSFQMTHIACPLDIQKLTNKKEHTMQQV